MSVAPESTRICLSALAYAVRNETGIFILWYLARYTVKALQGLSMLDVSMVLWVQESVVNGLRIQMRARAQTRQRTRGKTMNCKIQTKTRLRSNYSYYRILIVEDAQPITYICKHSESWNKSMSHCTAFRS